MVTLVGRWLCLHRLRRRVLIEVIFQLAGVIGLAMYDAIPASRLTECPAGRASP